ncbi:MAG: hypothetical protein R3A52_15970 [Polyangiales bacterium]
MRRWTFGSERRFALGLGVDGAEGVRLSASEAERALDAWLRRDGATTLGRSQMREVLRALQGDAREDPRRWRATLRAALRDGRLWMRVDRAPKRGTSFGAVEDHSSAAPPPERVSEVDHWIAIRLEDDGDPLDGALRAIHDQAARRPELRQGSLDKQGIARLDGIPAGECEVTFPDFDRRAWQPATPRKVAAPRTPPREERAAVAKTATVASTDGCVVTGFALLEASGERSKRHSPARRRAAGGADAEVCLDLSLRDSLQPPRPARVGEERRVVRKGLRPALARLPGPGLEGMFDAARQREEKSEGHRERRRPRSRCRSTNAFNTADWSGEATVRLAPTRNAPCARAALGAPARRSDRSAV